MQHQSQPICLHATCTLDILVVGPTPPYYHCPSDLQGVANCYVLYNFPRSYKRLTTPYSLDGKPSRGAPQRLPARTFRPTSCSFHLVSVPTVLIFPNSPDCRPDIGRLSPVLVRGNQDPSLIFTDNAESPGFGLTSWTLNGFELTEARAAPNILRPDRMHYNFISSHHSTPHGHASEARRVCGRSNTTSDMTRLQQKWMMYASQKYVQLRVGRAVQGGRDSCGRASGAVLLAFAVQINLKHEFPRAHV